jgi:glycosyltransferase involved in cell wall biosynthesis
MKPAKIVVVTGFFPYPPLHGGMVDVWKRIEGLKELGFQIDLVYTAKESPLDADKQAALACVNTLIEVPRSNSVWGLFLKQPLQVVSRRALKTVPLERTYDAVLLEGDYVGMFLENESVNYQKSILRVHNNEAVYFKNLAKSTRSILKKIYYRIEAFKFGLYSERLFKKVSSLWYISQEELAQDSRKVKTIEKLWMPPPFKLTELGAPSLHGKKVLFVGSLFMDNNSEALRWYLEKVHPLLREKYDDYQLVIAGSSGDRDEFDLRTQYESYSQCELHINVRDLSNLYQEATVFINPMQHGAGVKIKSIDALVRGLPLVSSSVGTAGIGLDRQRHYYHADKPMEFYECIVEVFEGKTLAKEKVQAAQNYLKTHHYKEVLKRELDAVTKGL